MDGDDPANCYAILGVDPGASTGEIRQAYRKLALAKHPDRGGDPDEFSKLSRAYEILSDTKARSAYDSTGRTTKLSPEEEFIEAFRSGSANGSSSASTKGSASSARNGNGEAQHKWSFDKTRSGSGGGFSANNSRGGVSGFSANPSGQRATDSSGGDRSGATRGQFVPGARVRLTGLQTQPGLNSVNGTLVKFHGDRWQVRLEADLGDKLFKAKNLVLVDEDAAPRYASHSAPAAAAPMEPAAYFIVGSWSNWRPVQMISEPQRRCHKIQVELPSSASESFQLFIGGDGLGRCIHPDRPDASPHAFHRLCGPDDQGQGLNWTIGKHPDDKAVTGARYEVLLIHNANGAPDRLDWVRLNPRPAESLPKPVFPARSAAAGNGSAKSGTAGMTISSFLQAAKPDWTPKDITAVCERLGKITINDLPGLLRAVRSEGAAGVNQRFKAAGSKAFTESTLKAMRDQAEKLAASAPPPAAPAPRPAAPAPPQPATANLPPLPTQEYRVVHEFAMVRQEPSLSAPLCGKKKHGDLLRGSEETFDGWVKLHGQPGYVIKDMLGKLGVGVVLETVGRQLPLVLPKPQAHPHPLTFEVVYKPIVAVRTGPSKSRPIQGTKKFGTRLRAEVQGYGGWVRLCDADGGGWMLTADADLGQLLTCPTLEERRTAEEALRAATAGSDSVALNAALGAAKRCGVSGPDVVIAEDILRELRQRESMRKELIQKAAAAKNEGKDSQLRSCVQQAEEAGFQEEKGIMQEALDTMIAEKAQVRQEHDGLLESLAAAAASGDASQIKVARNAAKAGGVTMKEIARIFALHSQGGA